MAKVNISYFEKEFMDISDDIEQELESLKLPDFPVDFDKYKVGSGIPHIYFKDYCIEKVTVPSLPEQQKIGKLFVDTDKTLVNIKNSIYVTQEFKKGLLQQMFV